MIFIAARVLLQAGTRHCRRPVMPGRIHVQIRSQLRPELGQDLLAFQRIAIGIVVQILHHLSRDERGIFLHPGTGRIAQDAKLDGQAVAVRLDVGIHATRIGLKVRTILRRSNLQRFLGGYSDPKNSLLAIMLKKIPSEDFRNLAGGEPPHNVHLP